MTEFKVGDRVKCIEENMDFKVGDITKITRLGEEKEEDTFYVSKKNKPEVWVYRKYWEQTAYKEKTPTHLVIWDEPSRDPHQFFTNDKKAKDFIKELSEKNNVVKDSIVLVEIKTAKRIQIIKSLKPKEYKI